NGMGRFVLSALYFFPVFAMLFALFFEGVSLYKLRVYINPISDEIELITRYLLALSFLLLIYFQYRRINNLNKYNSKMIDGMYDIIKESRKKLKTEEVIEVNA